jgi:hypothetical protein
MTKCSSKLGQGPILNPFNSTVGTKPATEAQLDSATFNGGMVLQILRSDQLIDGLYVVIDRMSSCENSSFSSNVLFCIFSYRWDRYKINAGINQLGNKGEGLNTEEG